MLIPRFVGRCGQSCQNGHFHHQYQNPRSLILMLSSLVWPSIGTPLRNLATPGFVARIFRWLSIILAGLPPLGLLLVPGQLLFGQLLLGLQAICFQVQVVVHFSASSDRMIFLDGLCGVYIGPKW
uniref:(northern house mosquito) hypothetical protein n=1 Tax=Culex pipiens TaxID=7175 RepID=A0A8D8ATR3_CULPI